MNRQEFQKLAKNRLKDAKALLQAKRFDAAYYLAGYAIECALKACIARKTNKYDFPPNRKTIDQFYSHDLRDLISAAGLTLEFESKLKENNSFQLFWTVVKNWNEKSRYETHTQKDAEDIYRAISNKTNGVLRWLKLHW